MQQHRTNMINEEWNETQNDAPFFVFYDMRANLFVLPDEMADVLTVGLQWFILISRLNHTGSHRPIDSHSKPYLHREKNIGFGIRIPSLLQSYELRGKQPFFSDFSQPLTTCHRERQRSYSIQYKKKKKTGPHGE